MFEDTYSHSPAEGEPMPPQAALETPPDPRYFLHILDITGVDALGGNGLRLLTDKRVTGPKGNLLAATSEGSIGSRSTARGTMRLVRAGRRLDASASSDPHALAIRALLERDAMLGAIDLGNDSVFDALKVGEAFVTLDVKTRSVDEKMQVPIYKAVPQDKSWRWPHTNKPASSSDERLLTYYCGVKSGRILMSLGAARSWSTECAEAAAAAHYDAEDYAQASGAINSQVLTAWASMGSGGVAHPLRYDCTSAAERGRARVDVGSWSVSFVVSGDDGMVVELTKDGQLLGRHAGLVSIPCEPVSGVDYSRPPMVPLLACAAFGLWSRRRELLATARRQSAR